VRQVFLASRGHVGRRRKIRITIRKTIKSKSKSRIKIRKDLTCT